MTASDKHSSLLHCRINYALKSLYADRNIFIMQATGIFPEYSTLDEINQCPLQCNMQTLGTVTVVIYKWTFFIRLTAEVHQLLSYLQNV
jgi:hypothetical protein